MVADRIRHGARERDRIAAQMRWRNRRLIGIRRAAAKAKRNARGRFAAQVAVGDA